ncbi:unnamed protein product, partial [Ectocarpus sp. 6 AP-2014]
TSPPRPLAAAAGATHQALLVSALPYPPPPPKETGKFHRCGDQIWTLSFSRLLPKQPWGCSRACSSPSPPSRARPSPSPPSPFFLSIPSGGSCCWQLCCSPSPPITSTCVLVGHRLMSTSYVARTVSVTSFQPNCLRVKNEQTPSAATEPINKQRSECAGYS